MIVTTLCFLKVKNNGKNEGYISKVRGVTYMTRANLDTDNAQPDDFDVVEYFQSSYPCLIDAFMEEGYLAIKETNPNLVVFDDKLYQYTEIEANNLKEALEYYYECDHVCEGCE